MSDHDPGSTASAAEDELAALGDDLVDNRTLLQVAGATLRIAGNRLLRGRSFTLVLLMLVGTFVFGVATPSEHWSDAGFLLLVASTAVVTLRVGRVRGRLVTLVIVTAVIAALAALTGSVTNIDAVMPAAGMAVCALLPFAFLAGISRRERIDIETVSAALSMYLILGFLFAFTFSLVEVISPPFFAQAGDASRSDFLYFSFVTLTTLGYGDLSPQSDVGRALAVLEAVLGQLYLVSAVATVVGNLGARRKPRVPGTSGPPDD